MLALSTAADEHHYTQRAPTSASRRDPVAGGAALNTGAEPADGTQDRLGLLEDRAYPATIKRLEAREHVCREGEPKLYIYQVEQGAVCLYKSMPDGHRQIMDFAYPGDFIGLGISDRHALSGQAIGPTRLKCVPSATIRQIAARDPVVAFRLYEALSGELAAARDLLATVGTRSATERVAAFLVALLRRNDRGGLSANRVVLPMLRSDIADFLSLTVETVSRTFTRLKRRGLIDLPQSAIVIVRDRASLERMASGDLAE
ncbi:MAG: helix-turn-helix domain-containing protein [Hyphomicrobium sp.]